MKTSMNYPLDKYFPGLGRQFFINPAHVNVKGGAEKYIPGLGINVYVPVSCIKASGGAEKYLPGLGKQFFINPIHVENNIKIGLSQAAPASAKVTITSSVSGGVSPYVTKYLSGTKTIMDFVSAGTSFTNTFDVTVNGTYTVYAIDAVGIASVNTISVSSLT